MIENELKFHDIPLLVETANALSQKYDLLFLFEKPDVCFTVLAYLDPTYKTIYEEYHKKIKKAGKEGKKYTVRIGEFEFRGLRCCGIGVVGHLLNTKFNISTRKYRMPESRYEWYLTNEPFFQIVAKYIQQSKDFIICSIEGNEPCLIKESNSIKMVHIGEYIDQKLRKVKGKVIVEGIKEKLFLQDTEIMSFNNRKQVTFHKVRYIMRHKNRDALYKVKTQYGREIIITESHSIFTFVGGRIISKEVKKLRKGDLIAIPCKINLPEKTITINLLTELLKFKCYRVVYAQGESIQELRKRRILNNTKNYNYKNAKSRYKLSKNSRKLILSKRNEMGVSQKQLAQKLDMSPGTISNIETGNCNPSKLILQKVCDYLDLDFMNLEKKILVPSLCLAINKVINSQFKGINSEYATPINIETITDDEQLFLRNSKGMYLYGSKNKREPINNDLELNENLAFLIGAFIAEGTLNNKGSVRWHLGPENLGHEDNFLNIIIKKIYLCFPTVKVRIDKTKSGRNIVIDNYVIWSLFAKVLEFEGKISLTKRIPSLLWRCKKEIKIALLEGYFLGDGTINMEANTIILSTVSKYLASDLSYLLLCFGVLSSISVTLSKQNHVIIEKPIKAHSSYRITIKLHDSNLPVFYKNHHLFKEKLVRKVNERYIRISKDIIAVPVREVIKITPNSSFVYDISMSKERDADNFLAGFGGIFCHNTDDDDEGELIGYSILKAAGVDPYRFRRIRTYTFRNKNLFLEKLDNPSQLDVGKVQATMARHILDFVYGKNFSRLVGWGIKMLSRGIHLSIGRVQTPTLRFIHDRLEEIKEFEPKMNYWAEIYFLQSQGLKMKVEKIHSFENEAELVAFQQKNQFKKFYVKLISQHTEKEFSKPLYKTDSVLMDMEWKLKIPVSEGFKILEALYQGGIGVLSYPRTSSTNLPPGSYTSILKELLEKGWISNIENVEENQTILGDSEGEHPGLHPIAVPERLPYKLGRAYELIVRRFAATFSPPLVQTIRRFVLLPIRKNTAGEEIIDYPQIDQSGYWLIDIIILIEKLLALWDDNNYFHLETKEITDLGYKKIEDPSSELGKDFLEERDGILFIKKHVFQTHPPSPFSERDLLRKMINTKLGTDATRPSTIKNIQDWSFCEKIDDKLYLSELGEKILVAMMSDIEIVTKPQLTREFEDGIEKVVQEEVKPNEILDVAFDKIREILNTLNVEQFKEALYFENCPLCNGTTGVSRYSVDDPIHVKCSSNGCKYSRPLG